MAEDIAGGTSTEGGGGHGIAVPAAAPGEDASSENLGNPRMKQGIEELGPKME